MDDDRNTKPDDLHAQAIRHADEIYVAEQENETNARDAQRFYAGEQWNDADKAAREKNGRLTLIINRLPAFVKQVTGDIRKDTPTMRFLPAKGGATQKTAEVVTGLVRNIEQASNARAAYVQAVDNACQAGIGWIRVKTEYSDDDGFEQDIRIRRVMDPLGIKCDPAAQEPDKSDARFFLVYDDMATDQFKLKYPDASVSDFPSPTGSGLVWKTEKTIRIAEYWYRKEAGKKTLYLTRDGETSETKPEGEQIVATREVVNHEIWQCIVSGREVIREPQRWPGRHFPFAPVIGEEIRLDGRTIRKGMVHDSRDAQRAYNFARTAAVEATSNQPKMPYMVTPKQVEGYENAWGAMATSNPAYMVYNPDPLAPGAPKREVPPPQQSGLDSQALIAANELEAITGIYKSGLGAPSNETSGRAIMARQREGDTGTFLYVDNLATALRRLGIILMDLIPKIYDTPRYVRVLKEDGTDEMAWINKEAPSEELDPATGAAVMEIEHDLSLGEYDVMVSTGASFATKRQESAETAQELVRAYPQLMGIAGDLLVKALDIPYSDEIAKRLERTIPQNLKEDQEGPPEPPPPNPRDVAATLKDAATVDKIKAETQGIELQNAQMFTQMQAIANSLPQIMAALDRMSQQGSPQAPGTPPQGAMPPEVAMPMPSPDPPPPGPGPMDGLPPMQELTT